MKTLKTKDIVKSPAEYVWFENEQRKEEDNYFEERMTTQNQHCPRVNEFVQFDDSENESKHIIKNILDEVIESDLDDLLENVMESSSKHAHLNCRDNFQLMKTPALYAGVDICFVDTEIK